MDTSTQNVFQSTLLIGNYFQAVKKQFEFNFSWELFLVQSLLTSRPSLDTFRLKLLFLFSLYTNEIYCFSRSVWCKVLLIYQTGRILCGKGGQFELACLFWPVVCNMRGRLNQVDHDLNCKILPRYHSKITYAKNHHFNPHHSYTREFTFDHTHPLSLYGRTKFSLLPPANDERNWCITSS